jgi:signal transduction histidine kinase
MRRLHAERELAIEVDVSPAHEIRGRREDLDEMLGNLLDNACKWADAEVRLSVIERTDGFALSVEDDGPGIPEQQRAEVFSRGTRLDEQTDGHGLGLGIVRDIVETWGGLLVLGESEWGGLKVVIELPRR